MDARIDLTSTRSQVGAAEAMIEVLSADAVKALLWRHRAVFSLGRYRSVELMVDDARGFVSLKPKLAARWLSRGRCRVVDMRGTCRDIDIRALAGDAARLCMALCRWPVIRRRIVADLSHLDRAQPPTRAGSGPPLYLRCDIAYGLRAGGSLGHVGGVVQGLAQAGLEPIFASVDRPTTVPESVPTIMLDPGPPQWLHSEQTMLAFNQAVVQQVAQAWLHEPPRFVYQRHALGTYAGLMVARRFGVPLVLEYNGSETWVAKHWGQGLKHGRLLTACENLVLRRADLVVTVSDVLKEELLARGIHAERIVTIPNGVDLDVFHPARDVAGLRKSLALDGMAVVGFIGTFGPWHGVEVLVQAFASALRSAPELRAGTRLLLVGEGSRSAAVRELVLRLDLHDVVVFAGLVPQSSGPDYVRLFDVAVAPTVPNPDGTPFFGSPTKIFEYMAAGRAIVASALGQVGDVLRDEETALLVPGGKPIELSNALLRLLRDGSLRTRLGMKARSEAERHHSFAARTATLLEAIGRLAAGNEGAALHG